MRSLARIFVLVKVRSVEKRQPVRVSWKMRGRPVEDHADSRLMATIHEIHKVARRSEATRHREIADRLVAPRTIERMLHDRHQFDVRVTHLFYVGYEFVSELVIGKPAVAFACFPSPRSRMNFVDRHG